jgi:hypothetical protein
VATEDSRFRFSAKFNTVDAIGHPMGAPVTQVRDVLLCPTVPTDTTTEEFTEHPPVASSPLLGLRSDALSPVNVGRGIRVDRLSDDDAQLVMNACSPRGHYFVPIRQFGQRFTFIRDVPLDEWEARPFQWDPEGLLSDAMIMSRLIRDNGYSTQCRTHH